MSTINPMPSKEDILFDGFARKRTSTGTWKEVYLVLTSDCLTVARDQSKKVSAQRAYEGAWTSEIARGTGELPEQMVVIDRIALVDIAWCHSGSNIRTPQVGPRPGHRVIKLEGGEGDDTQQGDASFCGDGQDSVDSPSSVLQDQQTFELLTNGSKSVQKGRKFVFQTRTVLESREWIEKIKSSVEEKKATVQRQLTLEMTPWTRYLHICKFIHESQWYRMFFTVLILMSFLSAVVEAQMRPTDGSTAFRAFDTLEDVFTCLFALEIIVGWGAEWFFKYLKDGWNIFNLRYAPCSALAPAESVPPVTPLRYARAVHLPSPFALPTYPPASHETDDPNMPSHAPPRAASSSPASGRRWSQKRLRSTRSARSVSFARPSCSHTSATLDYHRDTRSLCGMPPCSMQRDELRGLWSSCGA